MGFVSDWMDAARQVITSPTEFFEGEERRDGFGFPIKFAAVSFLISGVFSALSTIIYGTPADVQMATPVVAGIGLVSSIVGGIIGLVIGAGLVHIFVALFGGENGYSETLATLAYATVLSALGSVFSLIPIVGGLVGILLGLYGIYVQARGLEAFQEISFGKSLLAVILPGLILAVIAIILIMTVAASFVAMAGAPAL